jgi:hypothetical protein
MNEAKDERDVHMNVFDELDGALKPEATTVWMAEITHWEENPNDLSVVNPFEAKVSGE